MAAPKKKPTKKTVTIKPKKKGQKPITFKSNGSLTRLAGKEKDGKLNQAKVRQLAKGKGDAAKKARFYLNVLKK
jgi:hypothetical protein